MSRLAVLLASVTFILPQDRPPVEDSLEDLYKTASLWQVGENRDKVGSAREDLIARGDEALRFILAEKLGTTRGLEWRAISAVIGGIGEPAIGPLLSKLAEATPEEGATAVRLLGMLGSREEEPGWRDRILASRKDLHALLLKGDLPVRVATLAALSSLKDTEAVEPIVALLHDPAERIRREAAVSLGKLGEPRAASALAPMLSDPLFSIRVPAARALGKLGKEGAAALRSALTQGDFKVRGLAAETLGKVGDPAALDDVAALLGDPVPAVRAYAAEALGRLERPEALPRLRDALSREKEGFPRREMEKAIALLGEMR